MLIRFFIFLIVTRLLCSVFILMTGEEPKNYRSGMMGGVNSEQNKTVWFNLIHAVFATFFTKLSFDFTLKDSLQTIN